MNYEKRYKDGNISVRFKDDEREMLYRLKDGEPCYYAVDIVVKEESKVIARYGRVFEEEINSGHYNHFVKKFLTDSKYRTKFVYEGEWNGTIEFEAPSGVNKECEEAIRRLNGRNSKKLNFKDFASLKTYGTDSFSRMKLDKLLEVVSKDDVDAIETTFDDEKVQLTALRWIARGLKTELAIRKIKTDLEIRNNKKY